MKLRKEAEFMNRKMDKKARSDYKNSKGIVMEAIPFYNSFTILKLSFSKVQFCGKGKPNAQ